MTRPCLASPTAEQPVAGPGRSSAQKLIDAETLGARCGWSGRTTWRKKSAGLIPAPLKIGGCVRWRADEVTDWISCGCPPRSQWEQLRRSKTR